MPHPQRNSPAQRGLNPAQIEDARIINVDLQHWTVAVRTKHTHRIVQDIQVGAPYLHFNSGEGIYAMPEVGSLVKLCMPSDASPFILCFVTTMEREPTTGPGSQAEAETADTEVGSEVTFRAGRPRLQQGDLMMRCRDGNQIWLRRGGAVEIGSSGVSKRFYLPIGNMIKDLCESYQMLSAGGEISWRIHRTAESPESDARAVLSIGARTNAQDEHDVAMVQLGGVDDDVRARIVVAPDGIDAVAETVEAGARVFDITVTEAGDVNLEVWGDWDETVHGDRTVTVQGDDTATVSGSRRMSVSSDYSLEVSGSHRLQANGSTEIIDGTKVIDCGTIKAGSSGARYPVVLLTASMLRYLLSHTHTVMGSTTGTPTPTVSPSDVSARKLYSE